ncbi:hypothetical protein [Streptomyces sp. NPDC000880]
MASNISITAAPTAYQGGLLLAALADKEHRIPSDARGATIDLMHERQWLLQYRNDGTLLDLGTRHTPNTHFRLTHHGVKAAERFRERQNAKTVQPTPAEPATGTVPPPMVAHGPHLPEAAVYEPQDDDGRGYRDVVVLLGRPERDGLVKALSGRYGKTIRVPLADLQPLPELPPAAPGEATDWWTVTNRAGKEVAQVEAPTAKQAQAAAERIPEARLYSRREGGLSYRRLRSSEVQQSAAVAIASGA